VTADELAARLATEGLDASAWSNGPGDRYVVHRHAYDKVLVVARGSIVFGVPGAGSFRLATGDRLDLPTATDHDALVGPDGVTCLEAHVPAGTLLALRHLEAGRW
jgi:uncharacterized protein YjlB